jgi:transposase-like protein
MSKRAFWITKLSTKSKKRHDIKKYKEVKFMASKGQKFKIYSEELKAEVIKAKVELGHGYRYLSEKYEIPEGTINSWVYHYHQDSNRIVAKKRGRPKKEENIDYKERYEILKKFQEYLKEVDREKK